ncbi:MAG: hypothetical protein Q7T03_00405 [Deltaproteobacteria bacterium]|nr:hypothetical protein [Deltaproteobacteria bacterium]
MDWRTSTPAQSAYARGDVEEALQEIDKQKFRKQDQLLYLLDKAVYLHAAGRYKESNAVFEKAHHLSDYLESKYAHQEIAAAFTNETILPYSGETYERLLIEVYQMLNSALMGNFKEALIEVRQYNTTLRRFFGSQIPKEFEDPFALMLAATIWQANGLKDDARIDYQKAVRANPHAKAIDNETNVIVIVASGSSPVLEGEKKWIADILLELPKVKIRTPNVAPVEIRVDGKPAGKTIPLSNINAMAENNLTKKLEVAKDHKFVKTAFKQWAEMQSYYSLKTRTGKISEAQKQFEGLLAAAAISVLFNAFEEADLRIWSSLPANFQMFRLQLSPGEHEIMGKKISVPEKGPLFILSKH